MALTYTGSSRSLDFKGAITLRDGTQLTITTNNVASYMITESVGVEGVALGSSEAAYFTLTLANTDFDYTASDLDGAEVHCFIGIEDDENITYTDCGVWYVSMVEASEQATSLSLSGYDALATLFSAYFTDSSSAYPTTIGSLASTICATAGISLKDASFPNASIKIKSMPDWNDEVTLRDIIGYCAACAGGFARIARDGELEIVSYVDGETFDIDASMYTKLTSSGGADFEFNAIEIKFDDDDEDYSRYAIDSDIEDNATNTIQIEGNPLMTTTIVKSLVTELTGFTVSAIELSWLGDPAVTCGDILSITDTSGNVWSMLVNSQTFDFDGGLTMISSCVLPTLTSTDSSSYTTSGNLMDSNGNIRATRISGLDSSVISATTGYFTSLTADTINTDTLLASIIEALTLKADSIEATSTDTDSLTALIASIVEASIEKITAGTIETDELYSALAEITNAEIDSAVITSAQITDLEATFASLLSAYITSVTIESAQITDLEANVATIAAAVIASATIQSAQIDDLSTVILEAVHAEIETGEFTLAEITNLLANALILEAGVADSMYITNLSVTSANLLNAVIGDLVLCGDDGNYYRVFVSSDGTISTEQVTVTDDEISAGETSDGYVITATTANVESLSASTVLASQAVLETILTESLTAGSITAGEALLASATIPELYVTSIKAIGDSIDISANVSITSLVSSVTTVESTATEALEAAEAAQTAIDEMEVGGRNLLPDTRLMSTWGDASNFVTETDDEGFGVAIFPEQDSESWRSVHSRGYGDSSTVIPYSLVRGKTCTISFDYMTPGGAVVSGATNGSPHVALCVTSDTSSTTRIRRKDLNQKTDFGLSFDADDLVAWQRGSYTFTATDDFFSTGSVDLDADTDGYGFFVSFWTYTAYEVRYRRAKLEIGTVATDWTPAPEDAETAIDAAQETADTALDATDTLADNLAETDAALEAAANTADEALAATVTLSTQITQTAEGVTILQTQTTELEDRVETIESGVHIEGAEISIYTSDSPYKNTITNDGWEISENGTVVMTAAETKLTAPRVQVTDALIIGSMAWKPGNDSHLRLLKYGG